MKKLNFIEQLKLKKQRLERIVFGMPGVKCTTCGKSFKTKPKK